jgi:hypothetical protein
MAVMDASSGQVITTLPIGDHVDATAYDPERKLIFNSNGEGTVTVVRQENPDRYFGRRHGKDRAPGEDHGPRSQDASAVPLHGGKRPIRSAGRGTIVSDSTFWFLRQPFL